MLLILTFFTAVTEFTKDKWNSIELPNLPTGIEEPSFHSWFVKNFAQYMGKHMTTNIRDFSTNQSEDRSAKLRRMTNYRADELELFLRIVKDIYDTQGEENRQTFIGEGDFEMSDFVSKY